MVGGAIFAVISIVNSSFTEAIDWSWGPPLPQAQSAFGCTAGEAGIFVVGGSFWNTTETGEPVKRWLPTAMCFDKQDMSWQQLPHFPHEIGNSLVIVADSQLYVIGGRNDDGVLSTTYSMPIDRVEAGWSRGPDLPRPLCRLRGGYSNGTIYALTDMYASANEISTSSESSVIAWRVKEVDTQWENLTEGPPVEMGYSAATVCNDKLLVFGGAQPVADGRLALLDTTWVCDLQTLQWTAGSKLPLKLRDARATAIDQRYVAIVGGVFDLPPGQQEADRLSQITLSSQSLVYDIQDDCYTFAKPLYQPVADQGLAVFNSQLWAVGGEDSIHRTRTQLVQRIAIKAFLPCPAVEPEAKISEEQ